MTAKFIDRGRIFIQAGSGGDGHVGFRREKFLPKGGPDGGDGGRGGSILVVGSVHQSTLRDFQFKRHFRAAHGKPGGTSQKTGADGKGIEIHVPLGTSFLDDESGEVLCEILQPDEKVLLQKGGKGGKGNIHFKTSTNRAPRKATSGKKIEGFWVKMELRVLADVGLVGLPNAGKSTLLRALTAAKPKVGAYPFTTLNPVLGVCQNPNGEKTTIADVPGLIEGAHEGAGLGTRFLQHIERTEILLYLVGANPDDLQQTWTDFETTRKEIRSYNEELSKRPRLLVLNKIDLLTDSQIDEVCAMIREEELEPILISAKKNKGIEELKKILFEKTEIKNAAIA